MGINAPNKYNTPTPPATTAAAPPVSATAPPANPSSSNIVAVDPRAVPMEVSVDINGILEFVLSSSIGYKSHS
jgi:hypothetical protein